MRSTGWMLLDLRCLEIVKVSWVATVGLEANISDLIFVEFDHFERVSSSL